MGFGGFHGGGFHGGFGGFRGGFGGMRVGGFHPGFVRPAFVNRPFAFNRPFVRPAFVNRPFGFNRPFFFRRHRYFPAGAFAAGLVGGAALGTLAYGYPYYGGYPYYTTAAYGGACYVVRRPFVDWWGNLVIRRRLVCD
jgi:hypothetical protein